MSKSRKTSKINVPDSISRMIKDHINEEYNLKDKFRGADREDLIQAGLIGFLNAVKKFDPDKGKSIEAYAYKFIVREIQKEAWKTVVGEQNARYAAAVYMAKSELEDNGGSGSNSPDIDQISKRSGVSKQRVEQILAAIACKTYGVTFMRTLLLMTIYLVKSFKTIIMITIAFAKRNTDLFFRILRLV